MTSKTCIFGALSQQGHSIISNILDDPILSQRFSIRAVTRSTDSPRAKSLASKGVQVVYGDLDDPTSVKTVLQRVQVVVLITFSKIDDPNLKEIEFRQAKFAADAAVEAGATHIIFSSTPHATKLWNGGPVDHFDSKAEIEIIFGHCLSILVSSHLLLLCKICRARWRHTLKTMAHMSLPIL